MRREFGGFGQNQAIDDSSEDVVPRFHRRDGWTDEAWWKELGEKSQGMYMNRRIRRHVIEA